MTDINNSSINKDFVEKSKNFLASLRSHLNPQFRKQHIIKKVLSTFFAFFFVALLFGKGNVFTFLISLAYGVVTWIFWHYSFWAFSISPINSFLQRLIHFGGIWAILFKIFVQYLLILLWIGISSPIIGLLTWRKAVKNNKELNFVTQSDQAWNI